MKDLSKWQHSHVFHQQPSKAERSTWLVMWITIITMVVEIIAGWWFNSMALLADGWHMSSHALAIGLSALAYSTARRYAHDARFAFGTWKIEILAGFASSISLLAVALLMVFGSVERLISQQTIHYQEAIIVAIAGLIVNIVCAFILGNAHGHDHDHHHEHHHNNSHNAEHEHGAHDDLNLRSAYIHVLTDAATSVLAIIALFGGWFYGWAWLDPAMGIVGAILVAVWAKGLISQTANVLLDREMDHPIVDEIKEVIADLSAELPLYITDLHVWRVGKSVYSCALTVVTQDKNITAETIRNALGIHEEIVHSTIEIHYV